MVRYSQNRIKKITNDRYILTLDSLDFDLWTLSVGLHNLKFFRDPTNDNESGIALLDGHDITVLFNDLDVKYFNLLRFVLHNRIQSRAFTLHSPKIEIRQDPDYHPSEVPDTTVIDTTALQDFVDTTVNTMPVIIIDEFRLVDADFLFYEDHRRRPVLKVKGVNTSLIDVKSTHDAPIGSKNLDLRIDTVEAWVGKYSAKLDIHHIGITDSLFAIGHFHFRHKVTTGQLNKIKGYQASWLDINVKDLNMTGIDYDLMIADSGLAIRQVSLDKIDFTLIKDKSEPKKNPKIKIMPPRGAREFPVPLKIDTIWIRDGTFNVGLQAAGSKAPGFITFSGTKGPDHQPDQSTRRIRGKSLLGG